jgi:hypothetical protein
MRAALLIAAGLLTGCGPAETPAPAPNPSVVRIVLPVEPDVPLPALVAERCTACHSGEMIATQPPLSAEKWAATVKKMREVYHAELPTEDDAAIVAALVAMQAKAAAPARPTLASASAP